MPGKWFIREITKAFLNQKYIFNSKGKENASNLTRGLKKKTNMAKKKYVFSSTHITHNSTIFRVKVNNFHVGSCLNFFSSKMVGLKLLLIIELFDRLLANIFFHICDRNYQWEKNLHFHNNALETKRNFIKIYLRLYLNYR